MTWVFVLLSVGSKRMPHVAHGHRKGCQTCKLFAKLSRLESDSNSSSPSEDFEMGEAGTPQLPDVTESVPTVEELLQSSGCLGYGYEYGPSEHGCSEDSMPPDDPRWWGTTVTGAKPAQDGDPIPSAGSVPQASQEVEGATEGSGTLSSNPSLPPDNPSAYFGSQSSQSAAEKNNSEELREGMWVRREGPEPGMDSNRPPKRSENVESESEDEASVDARCAWLKVTGSPQVMQQFRLELQKQCPRAEVFEPVKVIGSRTHQMDCALLEGNVQHSHVLCTVCASEMAASTDRLLVGQDFVIHSDLNCRKLKHTMDSPILSWCSICNFQGLGSCSNEGGWKRGEPTSSVSPPTPIASEDEEIESEGYEGTEDEAASDPMSNEGEVAFEI